MAMGCSYCGKGAGHKTLDCPKQGAAGSEPQDVRSLKAQLKARDKRIKTLEEEIAALRKGVSDTDSRSADTGSRSEPDTGNLLGVTETRNCLECNGPFLPKRSDAKFCSTPCRVRFNRRKR